MSQVPSFGTPLWKPTIAMYVERTRLETFIRHLLNFPLTQSLVYSSWQKFHSGDLQSSFSSKLSFKNKNESQVSQFATAIMLGPLWCLACSKWHSRFDSYTERFYLKLFFSFFSDLSWDLTLGRGPEADHWVLLASASYSLVWEGLSTREAGRETLPCQE